MKNVFKRIAALFFLYAICYGVYLLSGKALAAAFISLWFGALFTVEILIHKEDK